MLGITLVGNGFAIKKRDKNKVTRFIPGGLFISTPEGAIGLAGHRFFLLYVRQYCG
jgi:hypothetical protein